MFIATGQDRYYSHYEEETPGFWMVRWLSQGHASLRGIDKILSKVFHEKTNFLTISDTCRFGVFIYKFDYIFVTRNMPNLTLVYVNYPMIKLVSICIVLLKIAVSKNLLTKLSEDILYSGHGEISIIEKERPFFLGGFCHLIRKFSNPLLKQATAT